MIKLSELKEIRSALYIEPRQLAEAYEQDGPIDFTVDDGREWRFIRSSDIDDIMANELEQDEYMLGCFNDWFLADILDIDLSIIQAMQKAEAYEALGKLVISMGKLEDLQQEYVRHDGYGHHFAHYDHAEHELYIGGELYHAFRVN